MSARSPREKTAIAVVVVTLLYAAAVAVWFLHSERAWHKARQNYETAAKTCAKERKLIGEKAKWEEAYETEKAQMPTFDAGRSTDTAWLRKLEEIAQRNLIQLGQHHASAEIDCDDVKELQNDLLKLGYSLPNYGADGDFGSETVKAVKAFQKEYGLPVDGVMNVGTDYDTLFKALDDDPQRYKSVEITGGSVNVRSAPGLDSKVLGVAHKGDVYPYQGVEREAEGKPWYLIEFNGQNAWVSSKYAKLVE